jgi:hypothetical protein
MVKSKALDWASWYMFGDIRVRDRRIKVQGQPKQNLKTHYER